MLPIKNITQANKFDLEGTTKQSWVDPAHKIQHVIHDCRRSFWKPWCGSLVALSWWWWFGANHKGDCKGSNTRFYSFSWFGHHILQGLAMNNRCWSWMSLETKRQETRCRRSQIRSGWQNIIRLQCCEGGLLDSFFSVFKSFSHVNEASKITGKHPQHVMLPLSQSMAFMEDQRKSLHGNCKSGKGTNKINK